MSKETHVFSYVQSIDLSDEGEDLDYTLRYRFIPEREATWETSYSAARIVPLCFTFVGKTGKAETLTQMSDPEMFTDLMSYFDEGDIILETRDAIAELWEERDRNRPDDTPCLERPWWETP